jgi:hypothetical protein
MKQHETSQNNTGALSRRGSKFCFVVVVVVVSFLPAVA